MDTSAAIDLASTIQSTSIEPHPDPAHDLNPSTTASSKIPVQLSTPLTSSAYTEIDRDIDGSLSDELSDGIEEDDIPFEVLKPLPRKTNLPPLPDMRFEQSYLKSIDHVKDRPWMVALITLRDQLVLPFVQGSVYSLALLGWRYWNRAAALSGDGVGARVRRWWWGVNNWSLDGLKQGKDGRWKGKISDAQLARRMGDYYETQAGAGGD